MIPARAAESIRTAPARISALRALADHADRATVHVFAADDVPCAQGQPSDRVWFLLAGLVDVLVDGGDGAQVVTLLGPGEWMGELGVLADLPRSATLRARRPSVALAFPREVVREVLDPGWPLLRDAARTALAVADRRPARARAPLRVLTVVGALPTLPAAVDALRRPGRLVLGPGDVASTDRAGLIMALHDAARGHDDALLVVGDAGLWRDVALESADRVLVLGDAPLDPALDARRVAERACLADAPTTLLTRKSHLLRPGRVDDLTTLLDGLLRPPVTLATLRAQPLFAALDAHTLVTLQALVEPYALTARQPLVVAGQRADGLYLVTRGELAAHRPDGGLVARYRAGDVVGEGAVLLDAPTACTLTATRDSHLVRLSIPAARALLRGRAEVALALARRLDGRAARAVEPDRLTIALVPAESVDAVAVGRRLAAALAAEMPTALLDPDAVVGLLGADALRICPGLPGEATVAAGIEAEIGDARAVVLVTQPTATAWSRRCVRQADVLVVVADAAAADPAPAPLEATLVALRPDLRPHLALLQPAGVRVAEGTARWLAARALADHHHLRADEPRDAARVARRLTGHARGVVFSGAATRGTAHLGLKWGVDALGVEVDIVAGNSSGGGVAALWAMGLPREETRRRAYRLTRDARPRWRAMGPPFVSLLSGRYLNRLMRATFGDTRLEDLIVPVRITALDLATGQLVVLRDGPVWQAVRASVSAPGFWPPVSTARGLLVDGGLVSNVPAEVIADDCRHGTLVVSDLSAASPEGPFPGVERYGYAISGWSILADRLLPWRRRRRLPSLYAQILYTMCRESHLHRARLEQLGEVLDLRVVTPRDRGFGFFDISEDETRRLEEQMTAAAREALVDLAPGGDRDARAEGRAA